MTIRPSHASPLSLGIVLLIAACSADTPQAADEATAVSPTSEAATSAEPATTVQAADGNDTDNNDTEPLTTDATADANPSGAGSGLTALPVREGPRSQTTGGVPHMQTDAVLAPEIDAELRRRVYSIAGIDEGASSFSLPGARSLLLSENLDLARPEVLPGGREFGHFHPDGSLHLWLPVERALEVDEAKWGELHPFVGRDNFWDGVVMIYVPETTAEADVALQLIADAYGYVVGVELDPASFD